MSRLARWLGPLLIAASLFHVLTGLVSASGDLAAIWRDGVFDTGGANLERQVSLWFILTGWMGVLVGQLVRTHQRRTGTVPAYAGWQLLAMSIVGIVLLPRSGFWLILILALLTLWVSYHERTRPVLGAAGGTRRSQR